MLGRIVINPRARTAPDPEHRRSPKVVVLILAAALTWLAGCANTHRDRAVRPVPVGLSPAPTIAPPAEAWKRANAYAASRDGAEGVVGLGDAWVIQRGGVLGAVVAWGGGVGGRAWRVAGGVATGRARGVGGRGSREQLS